MQNSPEQCILHIEALLNSNQQQGISEAAKLISSPDPLPFVPVIFNLSKNHYLLFTGLKILENHITNNWATLSENMRSELQQFLITNLHQFSNNLPVRSQLNNLYAKMAIRSYPDQMSDFLDTIIDLNDFEKFAYFLDELDSAPISVLSNQRKAVITQHLTKRSAEILQLLVSNYSIAKEALIKFTPFVKSEALTKINANCIVFSHDPDAFVPICAILLIDDLPVDFIQAAFNNAASLDVQSKDDFVHIVPVLQKYLTLLEQETTLQSLQLIHLKLLDIDFMDLIYYWEPFVVTIYSQFQKSAGQNDRFNIHYNILVQIRNFVIYHMIQPPDFIIPEIIPPTNDQSQRDNFNDMKSILLSFVGMTPKEVLEAFQTGMQYIKNEYSEENFLAIIWSLGCISGATNSQLESIFVVDSMKFVLDIFKLPNISKPVVASSFLYLAGQYAKAQKLTPMFIDVSINLAIQALDSNKTQRTAVNTLLILSKHADSMISKIPSGLIEIVGGSSINPEIFCIISEATGRLYLKKEGKIDQILKILIMRWENCYNVPEINFDVVREQQIVISGFVGLSKISPIALEKIVVKYRQPLREITSVFGQNILNIFSENGYESLHRDDVQLMIGFLQYEISLFTELSFKDCSDILVLICGYPNEIKALFPEILLLTESLLKCELENEFAANIHSTVIVSIEELISTDITEYIEFSELLPKTIDALAKGFFEAITPQDINFLLSILNESDHIAVLNSIKALDTCVEKADLKFINDSRENFFRSFLGLIIYRLLYLLFDGSKSFCYSQTMRFLRKLYDFIGTGKVRCQLFPDVDNINGMAIYLAQMTVQDFPLVTSPEIITITELLFKATTNDSFEELLAQYVSRVRQTTPGETLNYLRLQKFKDTITDFIYN